MSLNVRIGLEVALVVTITLKTSVNLCGPFDPKRSGVSAIDSWVKWLWLNDETGMSAVSDGKSVMEIAVTVGDSSRTSNSR